MSEEAKWLHSELEKQNDDQKSLKIETLERQLATQKETLSEHFKVKTQETDGRQTGDRQETRDRPETVARHLTSPGHDQVPDEDPGPGGRPPDGQRAVLGADGAAPGT